MNRMYRTESPSEEIREGFLCPVCLQDLSTISKLQVHFEEKHSNEDKAVFNSIKCELLDWQL